MPLATLDRVSIAYGHLPLLADASLQVEPRERVCVIGRNGTGKSTLLRVVSGELTPEAGTVWHQPGLRIGSLAQDVPLNDPRPVSVVVSEGINLRPDVEEWQKDQLVALTLTRLGLPAQASVQTLSGGWSAASCWHARSLASRICCFWTNRPITSTSRR